MVGGASAAHAVSLRLKHTNEAAVLALLASMRVFIAQRVILPSVLLTIFLGTWLAIHAGYPIVSRWLAASYVISVGLIVVALTLVAPRARRIQNQAQALLRMGATETSDFEQDIGVLATFAYFDFVLTTVLIYLMVFKPGINAA
jgi:uncharacterized membrane protein